MPASWPARSPRGGRSNGSASSRNRHQIGQQRVRGVSQSAPALHDRDLADEIRVEYDGVLLTLERREQIVVREFFESDPRGDAIAVAAGARDQLQPTARRADG